MLKHALKELELKDKRLFGTYLQSRSLNNTVQYSWSMFAMVKKKITFYKIIQYKFILIINLMKIWEISVNYKGIIYINIISYHTVKYFN